MNRLASLLRPWAALARPFVSFVILLAAALAACGSEPMPPREPAPPTPVPAAAPNAPAPAEAEVEATPDELPVADDFAAEAEQAIDEASYRAELDALEKEISADGAPTAP